MKGVEMFLCVALGVLILWLLLKKCGKSEGYNNDLSDLSGQWDAFEYSGADFKKHPAGQVTIIDSGENTFNVTLYGWKERDCHDITNT